MSKPIVTAIASFGMSGVVFQGPSLKVLPQQFKIHKIPINNAIPEICIAQAR